MYYKIREVDIKLTLPELLTLCIQFNYDKSTKI